MGHLVEISVEGNRVNNATPLPTTDGALVPLGVAQLTGMAASTALTAPAGSRMAILMPEAQGVRFRDDGTAPTAAIGMPLAAGSQYKYTGNLANIRFIQQVAGAILNVAFYG